jgi:hypothetical protein
LKAKRSVDLPELQRLRVDKAFCLGRRRTIKKINQLSRGIFMGREILIPDDQ